MTGPEYTYVMWRVARTTFGRRPWELDEIERAQAEKIAMRETRLILQALAAPSAAGVMADLQAVEEAATALGADYPSKKAFLEDLSRGGLDWDSLCRALVSEQRAGIFLDEFTRVTVDDEDIRNYYEANAGRMLRPERRSARHILITINEDYPENSRTNAYERLVALRASLLGSSDNNFAQLAKTSSECPSALDGGWLGEVKQGVLYPSLDAVLFRLQENEISEIVESALGFHLIYCEQILAPHPVPFEEAAPVVRKHLEDLGRRRKLRAFMRAHA